LLFLSWEDHLIAEGREPLINLPRLRNPVLRGGLIAFMFQYLLQAGLFFVVPLYLSVALGLSAIATGVRLLPLSLTLLLAAVGVPRLYPNVSPRLVVRVGFLALFAGIIVMVALLDIDAGPEIVTWPMLLAGLGIGALASQLGAVTVSSVPDERSGEVGGLQNTVTNLGASIGTALAGAVLISALTSSFFANLADSPDVPDRVVSQAEVQLTSGVPFLSDSDLETALDEASVRPSVADAIVDDNADARIDGLRAALAVLGLFAIVAFIAARRLPTVQPSDPRFAEAVVTANAPTARPVAD
jgi:Na+/melibiose symporter-like transporter